MANRVNVNITARDMTRGELARLRRNFRHLGQDLDRVVTARTRQNWDRLRESLGGARRELQGLRGNIPDDEFFRLDASMRRAQRTMQRGFSRVGDQAFRNLVTRLREVDDEFRRINQGGMIRVRVDDSAIRRADARLARWRADQRRNVVRIPVRPDVDRNRWRRGILGALTSPVRTSGAILGGILSDGLGQGIISGFRTAGPIGTAVFAGVLTSSVSIIGAALSGLLVTALGAAFVGIGVVSAAQSEKVKDKWKTTLETIKEQFASVGEPLIPVLDRALDRLGKMAEAAGPTLREALERTAPATEKFINSLADGFESFGKAAFQPIMDAWNVFAPVFGEEWNEFMDELGHSFKEMANLVKEHPTEIAMALDIVFEAIDLLVDTVTFFGRVWVSTVHGVLDMIDVLADGFETMGTMVLTAFGSIINGAADAFGWIPGIGPKLKEAAGRFNEFKGQAQERLRAIGGAADGVRAQLDRMNKKRRLEADISSWKSKLDEAKRKLKSTTDQKARAKLTADIRDLNNKIASARAKLNSLNGKTATTYVRTVRYGIGAEAANAARRATGGIVTPRISTAATGGARNNLTLVGEEGPELVRLPGGSGVRSNSDSRRLMRQSSGGDARRHELFISAAGDDVSQFLLRLLRRAVRDQGGDVQIVLGG